MDIMYWTFPDRAGRWSIGVAKDTLVQQGLITQDKQVLYVEWLDPPHSGPMYPRIKGTDVCGTRWVDGLALARGLEPPKVPQVPPPPLSGKSPSAFDVQVGGAHYKGMKIQPVEFAVANGLDFFQKDILKYITRRKGDVSKRIEDLNKAKHYLDMYIECVQRGDIK